MMIEAINADDTINYKALQEAVDRFLNAGNKPQYIPPSFDKFGKPCSTREENFIVKVENKEGQEFDSPSFEEF